LLPLSVSSEELFQEYPAEITDRPQNLKDLLKLKGKFLERFSVVPLD
jgi:hypothetical protein